MDKSKTEVKGKRWERADFARVLERREQGMGAKKVLSLLEIKDENAHKLWGCGVRCSNGSEKERVKTKVWWKGRFFKTWKAG